jgi:hypothetical protein
MNFEQIPEEDHELQTIPVKKLEQEAKKYLHRDGRYYYLNNNGFMYNDQGEVIQNRKLIEIMNNGQLIEKAA